METIEAAPALLELPFGEDESAEPSRSWARQVLGRLLCDPRALVGLTLVGAVILIAVLAPLITFYGPDVYDLNVLNQGPSHAHPLGTDYLGRDLWSRLAYGSRQSLPAGFSIVLISLAFGMPLGMIAGYFRGFLDDLIMRIMDIMFSIPGILLALGVVAILGPGLRSVVIAVGIAGVPSFSRVIRASTIRVRETDYVKAARGLGASHVQVLRRHIFPQTLDSAIILTALAFGGAVLASSALSYLGVGTQLPTADWGTLLAQGYAHMFQSASQVIFPGLIIMVVVFGVNLLGDSLNDALNPRLHAR